MWASERDKAYYGTIDLTPRPIYNVFANVRTEYILEMIWLLAWDVADLLIYGLAFTELNLYMTSAPPKGVTTDMSPGDEISPRVESRCFGVNALARKFLNIFRGFSYRNPPGSE